MFALADERFDAYVLQQINIQYQGLPPVSNYSKIINSKQVLKFLFVFMNKKLHAYLSGKLVSSTLAFIQYQLGQKLSSRNMC